VVAEGNMKIEELDKRFGAIAVEEGFITIDQLMDALEVQVREELSGIKHRLIGRILFDLGFMTFLQIREVLATMNSPSDYQVTEEVTNITSSRS
jgi:hypothetical protein